MSDVRTRAQEALTDWDEAAEPDARGCHDASGYAMRNAAELRSIVRDLLAENTQLETEMDANAEAAAGNHRAYWKGRAEAAEAKITAALELHRYRGNRSLLDCSCGPSLLPCPTRRILSGAGETTPTEHPNGGQS